MHSRFAKLKDDFAKFVGTFGTWAKDKEVEDNKIIAQLQKDIVDLQDTLAKIDTALNVLYMTLGATLPLTGIIALISGPFAPLVLVRLDILGLFIRTHAFTTKPVYRLPALSLPGLNSLVSLGSSLPRMVCAYCFCVANPDSLQLRSYSLQ